MDTIPDADELNRTSRRLWDSDVLPTLESYVRIPNLSPHFAPDWERDGHMDKAVDLISGVVQGAADRRDTRRGGPAGGTTPTILVEIPANDPDADDEGPQVLMYGHLDKQPEFNGWLEGLSPWEPVRRGDRLYGRGTADDGYSVFSALTAIETLRSAGGRHSRCLILIEGSEESGSIHLPEALEVIGTRIGNPGLVLALDSGCATYDRLWCTSSLRGGIGGTLKVEVLDLGVHSGSAGGVVPSSFRIARNALVENRRRADRRDPLGRVEGPGAGIRSRCRETGGVDRRRDPRQAISHL